MTSSQSRLEEISSDLLKARRSATALPGFPGALPENFDDAYVVQSLSRQSWDDDVVGWKVGGVPPDFIAKFNETHLVGPIFARSVKRVADQGEATMPVFDGGFAAVEPEFVVQLGETRAQDRLFIGAEIASSPMAGINGIGPIAVICDFGNNNGLILGPEVIDWRESGIERVQVECMLDYAPVGSREVSDVAASADRATNFLLSLADRKGFEVPVGTYVSTGAITGIHEAEPGAVSHVSFGRLGSFSLSLEVATPA